MPVSKFYGPFCAVANMSLAVQKGEFVSLLGPSGCGKTSTLQVIAGFAKEGSVVLMVAECVTANNSEPVWAQKLAEHLLTAEAQGAALQQGNPIPSNPKTQAIDNDSKARLKQFAEYMKTAVTVDWDVINESRPAWNARWNRIIER